jgi:drug/metabolite transporter (DMT)-like permease
MNPKIQGHIPSNTPALGIGFMMAAMLMFASVDVLSRHLTQTYSVPQILMVRFVLFFLFAVLLIRPRNFRAAFRSKRPSLQILRGFVMMAEIATFTVGLRYLPLADIHSVAAAAPLVVVALAIPLLGEKVGLHRWAAVLLGFVGVLVIVRPGFGNVSGYLAIAVVATFLWGLYQTMSRMVARYDDHNTTFVYTATIALIVSCAVGPFFWQPVDWEGWGWLAMSAVFGGAAHYFLIRATAAAEASMLQPFSYTLVLWATLLGFLVFGEYPDDWTIVGGIIIVAAGLYAMHRERAAFKRK